MYLKQYIFYVIEMKNDGKTNKNHREKVKLYLAYTKVM